jgi:hypothetical protein
MLENLVSRFPEVAMNFISGEKMAAELRQRGYIVARKEK